jgi:CrcB protein
MNVFQNLLWVALGGMLGSAGRYLVSVWLLRAHQGFPWPTFAVNITGSLLFGLVLGWAARQHSDYPWVLLLATGFCGGFTTFSALSAESLHLIRQQLYGPLALYLSASLILGIGAAALGFALSKHL